MYTLLSTIRGAAIALLLLLLSFSASYAQAPRTSLKLDTTDRNLPLTFTLTSNARPDIVSIRIVSRDPVRFASFRADTSFDLLPEGSSQLRLWPHRGRLPASGPLFRALTDSSSWTQTFTVSYLNENEESVAQENIGVDIPTRAHPFFPGPCSRTFVTFNTGVGLGYNVIDPTWTIVSTPAGPTSAPSYTIPANYGYWVTSPGINWLGSKPNVLVTNGGHYLYRRYFCASKATTATITMQIAVDGSATVSCNGSSAPASVGYWAFSTITLSNVSIHPGENYVQVDLSDIPNSPTGFEIRNSSIQTAIGDLGLQGEECCKPLSGITGLKIWDLNCNGKQDEGEPGLAGWTITLTPAGGSPVTAVTDVNGRYNFTGLYPGTYTITETSQTGYNPSTSAGPFTIVLGQTEVAVRNFLNCKVPDCKDLFHELPKSGVCCQHQFAVSNGGGSVVSMEYTVIGGTASYVQTLPCSYSSTVPANVMGSSTGTVLFSTPCNQTIQVLFGANSNTATGNICVRWHVTFKLGLSTFTCDTTFCYTCERMPKDCGRALHVTPATFQPTNTDYRTFTISNVKQPASQISSIDIRFINEPLLHHIGGGLVANTAPMVRTWTANSPATDPYTRIRFNCDGQSGAPQGPAATSWVRFNLGVDRTLNYSGVVHLKVGYCDGDTCEFDYLWKPPIFTDLSNATRPLPRDTAIRAIHFEVTPPDSTASIAVKLADTAATLLGATLPNENDDSSILRGARVTSDASSVLYVLPETRTTSQRNSEITLFHSWQKQHPDSLEVTVQFFDSDGREIGHTTKTVQGTAVGGGSADVTSSIVAPGMSLDIMPNPAISRATITLRLERTESLSVVLRNLEGKIVRNISEVSSYQPGTHTFFVQTADLASGTYFLEARSASGKFVTERLQVVH